MVFGGATLQDFAFAMLVGIASGTYSSIFIASPVLTAWKEREPGFVRRRLRIAEVEGGVPAYADDIEMAKLGRDDETEAELELSRSVEGPAASGSRRGGDGRADRGDRQRQRPAAHQRRAATTAIRASTERRQRNAERRAPRSPPQTRKG